MKKTIATLALPILAAASAASLGGCCKKDAHPPEGMAEARNVVGQIKRALVAAAAKEEMPADGTIKPDAEKSGPKLPASGSPVPASPKDVAGKPYQSKPADWASWKALGFSLSTPQHCQYQWKKDSDMIGEIKAKCDFDGDGHIDFVLKQHVHVKDGKLEFSKLDENKVDQHLRRWAWVCPSPHLRIKAGGGHNPLTPGYQSTQDGPLAGPFPMANENAARFPQWGGR